MSVIRPEDFMRFFEKTWGVRFEDIRTGKSALEVFQDEATQREYKMGEF